MLHIIYEDERWQTFPLLESVMHTTFQVVSFKPLPEVNLVLGNNDLVQSLNATYRNRDTPTDVLSFPLWTLEELEPWWQDSGKNVILGDIILGLETMQAEAKVFGHHVYHLFVHGLLHLLGYDHIDDKDAEIMEEYEVRILDLFHIPNPYLT